MTIQCQPRGASCAFFCLASSRAMRTPSSSARLLKAKLFPSPARRRGVLMKRCSPRGRSGSQFDMKNLLSKSPRSNNLKSHRTTAAHANGFSVKRLLELTPRTKRARSSSAVTPEPGCKHKRKSSTGSVIRGTDTVTRRSLFSESLPEQSSTEGHGLVKVSPAMTAEEVHQIEAIFCPC